MNRKSVAALMALGLVLSGWSKAEAAVIDLSGIIQGATLTSGMTGAIIPIFASDRFTAAIDIEDGAISSISFGLPEITFQYGSCGMPGSSCSNDINSLVPFIKNDNNPGFFQSYNNYGNLSVFSIHTASIGAASGYFSSDGAQGQIDADFRIYSVGRASNGGMLNATFIVQPVPLPTSLPMFGAAVLGLGGIAWARRRHAQPVKSVCEGRHAKHGG